MDNSAISIRTHDRRWAILAVLCLSLLVAVIDNTIVNVALPTLSRDLQATTGQLQWIVDAYTLVFAGLLLTAGTLGDRRGRKGALLIGLGIFAAGSLAASLTTTADQLILARAVMGTGAAFVMPATLSILTNVFTDARERAGAIALWAAVSGLAIALGPVTGGLLLQHFGWGSIFLVNLPFLGIALVAGAILIPRFAPDASHHHIDVAGAVLSIVGLGAIVWGLIEAPTRGWTDPLIVGSFAFGVVVLALFVRHELRTAEPMLQLRWFANGRFSAASVSIMLLFFALTGFIFGVTQYLQAVKGYSALAAGIRTLPFAVAVMVWAPLSAKLAERFGTKLMVSGGLSVFGIGLLVAATLTTTSGYGLVVVSMVLMGSGMGLAMAPATDSVMGALPAEEAGVGSAVNDTTRELGATLGVAVGGSAIASVYSPKIAAALAGQPIPPTAAAIAKHSIEGALAVAQQAGPRADALVPLARHAFTQGLRLDSLIAAGVVFLGAAVAARWLPARAGQGAPAAGPLVGDLTVDAVGAAPDEAPVVEPAPSLVRS